MHATLKRRLERLEDRSDAGSGKPRKVQRIVVRCLGREPGLERTRSAIGRSVRMALSWRWYALTAVFRRLSEEALDRFVESFPVRVLS